MEYAGGTSAGNIVARYAKLHLYDAFAIRNHAMLMLVMK